MNHINPVKKWRAIIAVVMVVMLSLVGGVALADSPYINDPSVTGHTDLSLSFLGQIFGTVGGSLQGTSGQMLGMIFYVYNQGLLWLIAFILLFTIVRTVFTTAYEGSFMGQHTKTLYICLRVALGVALVIPNASTGYSVSQEIVMKGVVLGVSFADQTWRYGLEYLRSGGMLWQQPNTGGSSNWSNDGSIGKFLGTTDPKKIPGDMGLEQKILASEVCMVSSSIAKEISQASAQNSSGTSSQSSVVVSSGSTSTDYVMAEDDLQHQFQFPGWGNTPGQSEDQSLPPQCGSVNWDSVPGAKFNAGDSASCSSGTGSPHGDGSSCQYSKQAIYQVINDLMPVATKYACSQATDPSNTTCANSGQQTDQSSLDSDIESALSSAFLDYVNLITPLATYQTMKSNGAANNFLVQSENEGWFSAGRYYWDLTQLVAQMDHAKSVVSYYPTTIYTCLSGNDSACKALSDQGNKTMANLSSKLADPYAKVANQQIATYAGTSMAGSTGTDNDTDGLSAGTVAGYGILSVILPFIGDYGLLLTNFDQAYNGGAYQMGFDPILFLHNIGTVCITLAGDIWFGPIIPLMIAAAVSSVCTSVYNAYDIVSTVVDWIKPFFLVLATTFLSVGIVLSMYVPLYPWMVMLFTQLGWAMTTVEVMAAAPVMALGVTLPGGHDFFGKAESGITILLGVILRPVLITITFIAALILMLVAFRMVIYGFSGVVYDLFTSNYPGTVSSGTGATCSGAVCNAAQHASNEITAANSSIYGLFINAIVIVPGFLVIFAAVTYYVVFEIFSFIPKVPDGILRWIGGHKEESPGAHALKEIEGAASGMGRTLGGAGQAAKTQAKLSKKAQTQLGIRQ